MNDSLSRRGFIAGIAGTAGAIGLSAAEQSRESSSPRSSAPPQTADHGPARHDDEVAESFCIGGRKFLDADAEERHVGVYFYGLMCAALKTDSEMLLPATSGKYAHEARLYAPKTSAEQAGEFPDYQDVSSWKLDGYMVEFIPLTAQAIEILPVQKRPSDRREHRDRHPFSHFESVRNLLRLTGKGISVDRNDPTKVNCRVKIPDGHVSPVLPYSELGRRAEWKARHDSAWRECATTDTLLYVRDDWPDTTEKIGVRRTKLGAQMPKDTLVFHFPTVKGQNPKQALFAVTHAMPMARDPYLEHTRAYSHLLGIDENQYKVPKMVRGCYGEEPDSIRAELKASSRDGHCEISWDGEG